MTSKAELRAALRAHRRAWWTAAGADDRRRLQDALRDRLLAVAGRPGVVAGYSVSGSEIDPAPALAAFAALGASIALPCAFSAAEPIAFRRWSPGDPLVPGLGGIAQPHPSAPEARPDLVLVPLVGADMRRNRLGQGAGHYDRALALLRAGGPCRFIGLAWDIQIVPHIPTDPWDVPLDLVVTPTRILG